MEKHIKRQIEYIIDYIYTHEIYGLNEDGGVEKADVEINEEKGIIIIASEKYSIEYDRTIDGTMFVMNDVIGWGEESDIDEMISEIERVFIIKEKK